jgi:hypothetical protein
MSRDNLKTIYDDTVEELLEYQGFNTSNIEEAPRSIYKVGKLYEALELYAPGNQARFRIDGHLKKGIGLAFKAFAKPRNRPDNLKVLEDDKLVDSLKLSKSSGLPMLTSKMKSLIYSTDRMEQVIKGVKSPNPCIAYKRTQEKEKTRLVWGYPLEMTMLEAQFARPLIDQFLIMRTPLAFGMKKNTLGALLDNHVSHKTYQYAIDYSKFDSSINSKLIHIAFSILATWFDQEDMDNRGWDQLVKYFITTPIVMPDGNLYTGKRHGVPSGSYFTQLIDSIVNVMLIGAVSSEHGFNLHWRDLFVLGDDSIFGCEKKLNLEQMAQTFKRYGITMNAMKSKTQTLEFLGAVWKNCLPDLAIDLLIKKALFPENFRNYRQVGKRKGATNVLTSLGGQYRSGYKLTPRIYRWDYATIGMSSDDLGIDPNFMSGSDKYHFEEKYGFKTLKNMNKKVIADLSYRMLT